MKHWIFLLFTVFLSYSLNSYADKVVKDDEDEEEIEELIEASAKKQEEIEKTPKTTKKEEPKTQFGKAINAKKKEVVIEED